MSAGNIANLIFRPFVVMVLFCGVLVSMLASASLAGFFELGVPVAQSNMHRGLSTAELVSLLLVGLSVAGAALFLLRRL